VWAASPGPQERVNARENGVRRPSAQLNGYRPRPHSVAGAVTGRVTRYGRCEMADLLYAVLLIAVFAVLALTLRGLEKL
jgi:hypothetical protein